MSEISPPRVICLGLALVAFGAIGFHEIDGMIAEDAEGTKIVNSIYCSVITLTTIGFGDICPGNITGTGRTFLVVLAFMGLGMFCGPIMDLTASWKDTMVDKISLIIFTVAGSVFVFTYLLEEMSESEAAYFSIITGTTIGYGDISPKSDVGKLAVAVYAVLAVNVVASLLEPAKEYLQSFCEVPLPKKRRPKKQTQSPSKAKASNDKLAESVVKKAAEATRTPEDEKEKKETLESKKDL